MRRCADWSTICARASPRSGWAAASARASVTSRATSCCRATALPALIDPGSPFLELSQLAAYGLYDDEVPVGRHHHRHRPRLGARMRDRCQRRHGEGRHLFPDHGEEAPARAGDRAAEPAALHLSGRFRRRLPADAGRGLPRPRAFRPHLLQPGQSVGAGHSADRRGDGLMHRRRRLCAGDERRDHHRAQAGHDLPRRPAAGEGRHRRDRQRRGPGRRRRACAHLGRGRSLRARRPARAGAVPAHRRGPEPRQAAAGRAARAAAAALRSGGTVRRGAGRSARDRTTCARSSRASSMAASSTSSSACTAPRWSAALRISTAIRSASSPTTASCSRSRR